MALTMAAPWRDRTGVWYLRQRTPQDLVDKLGGRTVTLPIGDGFATVKVRDVVQASLRTKDNREAKERHATADAALRRYWTAQRAGPVKLTHRQIMALAGAVYRDTVSHHEDDPGNPESWLDAEARTLVARVARTPPLVNPFKPLDGLQIGAVDRAQAKRLDGIHGADVDAMLARKGLVVDAESREALVRAVAKAFEQAARQLRRNAEGDYRPDGEAQRFPEWVPPKQAEAVAPPRLTVEKLAEKWAAFQCDKLAPNSVKRYGASHRSLASFTKGREAADLTGDDIHAWAMHRQNKDGIAAKVVNKNDLVAVSSMFRWAMGREAGKLVTSNPAAGVKITEPRAVETRERTFREAEIAAILNAALSVRPDPKNPTAAAAKRWCPWLAAYSGARISELTGLRGDDVRVETGVAVMSFRKTKTGAPRTVPLHPHLIEQGFLDFARERGTGPLFLDPKRHRRGMKTDPVESRSQKIAKWVREVAKLETGVAPDHGWRHTWKTKALEIGMPERISDAITGHRVRSVARAYETPTVAMMAEAMRRFPKYGVPSSSTSDASSTS